MKLYIYGTYEHSQKGYMLMRVNKEGLEPVAASEDSDALRLAREFFFYDGFRMVWRDVCTSGKRERLALVPEWTIAAVRGMEGNISGRRGNVNLAAVGEPEESSFFRRMVLGFLGDYDFHVRKVFSSLSIGEGGVLATDGEKLLKSLMEQSGDEDYGKIKAYKGGQLWEALIRLERTALTERDLLRFAVCQSQWKEAARELTPGWLWKKEPPGVIGSEVFERLCLEK